MAEEIQPLTLPQVAKAAEVEYRTLHTWLKRGLLRPSYQSSSGSGNPNLFAFEDVLEARILADLRRAGFDLGAVERTAQALQAAPERLTGAELLLINGTVSVLESETELEDALATCSPSLIYHVGWARQAVEATEGAPA